MNAVSDRDARLISRYVDGLLEGPERIDFERRLLQEPDLRSAVEAARETGSWFENLRGATPRAPADFSSRVLAAVQGLPPRRELLAEAGVPGEIEEFEAALARTGRRLVAAAALVLATALALWAGLRLDGGARRLEASPDELRELRAKARREADTFSTIAPPRRESSRGK